MSISRQHSYGSYLLSISSSSNHEKHECTRPHNLMCMMLNRKYAYEMMEGSNTKYDLLVSTRTDLWFEQPINWPALLDMKSQGYLCIPNPKYDYKGVNDQFAAGDYHTMSIYMKIYDSAHDLLENQKVLFHPETMLAAHLRNHDVRLHRYAIRRPKITTM